ncbi:hypothetical protein Pelo_18057 [Pelomyxa schiedti]|nr:hypothetical protein Pelo_18057 [Pelomyxa schiedti]
MLQAQRACEQILALVMASHNRCGASSPARRFVSLPGLATAPLWDWCLGPDSEIALGVSILVGGHGVAHYVILGISTALMSITRVTFRLKYADLEHLTGIKMDHNQWADRWLAPHPVHQDKLVVETFHKYSSNYRFYVVDLQLAEREGQSLPSLEASSSSLSSLPPPSRFLFEGPHSPLGSSPLRSSVLGYCSNNKWWVCHCGYLNGGVPSLVIADLDYRDPTNHQAQNQNGVVAVVCPPFEELPDLEYSEWKKLKCGNVSFNNNVADEALLVFDNVITDQILLVIVDVNETHTTNKTAVLSITRQMPLSPHRKNLHYFGAMHGLAMKPHTPAATACQQRVLLLHDSENRCLYEVAEVFLITGWTLFDDGQVAKRAMDRFPPPHLTPRPMPLDFSCEAHQRR